MPRWATDRKSVEEKGMDELGTAGIGGWGAARRLLLLAFVLALPGGAQNSSGGPQLNVAGQIAQRTANMSDQFGEADPATEQRRQRMLNAERQKSLVADTNKLLRLSADLYSEVFQTNPDRLTPAQLRRLAEIEKLARSVKEKMSDAASGGPVFRSSPVFTPAVR
ncbi:MAG: hypothetical protein WCE75_15820 [Terracidiphilus sp.]